MEAFLQLRDEWLNIRSYTIQIFFKYIEELAELNINTGIAQIVGTSVSIVSTICTIVSIAAIPFTAGASVPAAVGFGVLGGGSSVANIATSIIKASERSGILKKLQDAFDRDREITNKLILVLEKIKKVILAGQSILKAAATGVKAGLMICEKLATREAIKMAKILEVAGKGIRIASIAVNVALIPVDVVFLVTNSIAVHKRGVDETVKNLKQVREDLKAEQDQINSAISENERMLFKLGNETF